MSYTTGSWFYVVGMLIAIGGEIYALRMARPAAVVPAPASPINKIGNSLISRFRSSRHGNLRSHQQITNRHGPRPSISSIFI